MTKVVRRYGRLLRRPTGVGRFATRPARAPERGRLPRELAGKWVAWSHEGELLASGNTLAEVRALVGRNAGQGVSFELASRSRRVPESAKG